MKLQLLDVQNPLPSPDQIVIKTLASSINAADYRSLQMGIIPKNKIFGADVSGIVHSVGANVSSFKPGDEVVGELSGSGFGGWAQYSVGPAYNFVLKPSNLSHSEAAAVPLAAITALQAFQKDKGFIPKVKLGSQSGSKLKVLIVGSSGGVGTFAIQLASYFGAEVTAVCSSRNYEQSLSLGATRVIDYSKEDFKKTTSRYDLILGVNGNYSLSSFKKLLAPNGRYIMIGGSISQIFSSLLLSPFYSLGSQKMGSLMAKTSSADLSLVMQLASEGKIRPVIEKFFPLEQTAEAFAYLSKGHARGKIVITI